jgi:hypothetical protein
MSRWRWSQGPVAAALAVAIVLTGAGAVYVAGWVAMDLTLTWGPRVHEKCRAEDGLQPSCAVGPLAVPGWVATPQGVLAVSVLLVLAGATILLITVTILRRWAIKRSLSPEHAPQLGS